MLPEFSAAQKPVGKTSKTGESGAGLGRGFRERRFQRLISLRHRPLAGAEENPGELQEG
jgi:hypothetical protein